MRDHGVGLKPGEATRVFNRFWRADPARARTTGGTGLGLSIAVEDARLHGGWLQAWGEPGGGSQFRLTLPRTAGRAAARLADTAGARGLAAATADSTTPGLPRAGGDRRPPCRCSRRAPATVAGPVAPGRPAAAPTADPTALPGNGARVVPGGRPSGATHGRDSRRHAGARSRR